MRSHLLVRDGDAVRLVHPLVGTVARSRATPDELRAVHAALARLVPDVEECARHLAASSEAPDAAVAEQLARAASYATARNAPVAAAELAAAAHRFTSPADAAYAERLFDAADRLLRVGHDEDAHELLAGAQPLLATPRDRGWALHLLAMATPQRVTASRLHEQAAEELRAEPALRATVLAETAHAAATTSIRNLEHAYELGREACELAMQARDELLELRCRVDLAWTAALLGRPDAADLPLAPADAELWDNPNRIRALWHLWRGELAQARPLLEGLRRRAAEVDEDWGVCVFALHAFELAERVGDVSAMERELAALELVSAGLPRLDAAVNRCRAAVAAARGDREAAEAAAARVRTDPFAGDWQLLEARRLQGLAAASAGDPAGVVAVLQPLADDLRSRGVHNPGVFPVAATLIEALVETAAHDRAAHELELLDAAASEQESPWGHAAARRAWGAVLLARGETEEALATFADALDLFASLGLALGAARARLALGRAERQAQLRRQARETLTEAAAELDRLGADGFAAQARAELERIPGRRAATALLTSAEERVARLVADGRTNAEVAEELFVTVGTVERHLSRIYAKLGVRSRTELARRYPVPD